MTDDELLAELDKIIAAGDWWKLPASISLAFFEAYKVAFSAGASAAADEIQRVLFSAGMLDSAPVGISFELTNPATLAQLEEKAALLVRRIDDGTRYYLKEMLVRGVEEGLDSPGIATAIKEGATVEDILKDKGFLDDIIQKVKADLEGMAPGRVESIVNTEINRAESEGRLKQWSEMGLTRKLWRTSNFANVCHICRGNEALGYVPMDHVYDDVFDGTLSPPAHPKVCRCHLEFDEEELMSRAGELKVWSGD